MSSLLGSTFFFEETIYSFYFVLLFFYFKNFLKYYLNFTITSLYSLFSTKCKNKFAIIKSIHFYTVIHCQFLLIFPVIKPFHKQPNKFGEFICKNNLPFKKIKINTLVSSNFFNFRFYFVKLNIKFITGVQFIITSDNFSIFLQPEYLLKFLYMIKYLIV